MYKVEFFSYVAVEPNDGFKHSSGAYLVDENDVTIVEDYLTMNSFDVPLPVKNAPVYKGDYCRISIVNGSTVGGYLVSDVTREDTTTTVALRPLLAVLDVDVFSDDYTDYDDDIVSASVNVAKWFAAAANSYLDGSENDDDCVDMDSVYTSANIAGSCPMAFEDDTVNLLDVLRQMLTMYRIAATASLGFGGIEASYNRDGDSYITYVRVRLRKIADTATIEADLDNVLDKEITLGDSYGSANKYYLRKTSTDKETDVTTVLGTTVYYLHTDGTVDTDSTKDRITPVHWELGTMEDCDTWDADALAQATDALTAEQYDNEITMDFRRDDTLINPTSMSIGTEVTVYSGGTAYKSILTGREWDGNVHRLIFGQVRVDLTKKLILQRRG